MFCGLHMLHVVLYILNTIYNFVRDHMLHVVLYILNTTTLHMYMHSQWVSIDPPVYSITFGQKEAFKLNEKTR